jgi:Peptidase family M23
VSVYRLPFDNAHGGWSMGHGNFDDPVGGNHGTGQPFAWDFGYDNPADPDGTKWGKIYAARAGTVIDLRDGVTKVLTDSDPIWGPGNFLLVRHADNTISAYDHLKVNTIRVKVGQYVEQGTWLATVGNTGSTSGGVVHLHFECHSWWNPGAIGDPSDDVPEGASILIHFTDPKHPSWRPVDGATFGADPPFYRQDGWRFCHRCGGLYFSYQGVSGHCAAGGPHATTGGDYTLSDDVGAPGQAGWKFCKKCNGMFFSKNPGSRCPVTTPTKAHDGSASNVYRLVNNVGSDPGQHHWRWCSKCQGLWFGDAATSICPGNAGGPHSSSGSGDYSLALSVEDIQQGWRWCGKCQGLFYAPNGVGVCKAGGGHSSAASSNYTLAVDVSPVNASGTKQKSVPPDSTGWQGDWRYCKKCGLLWMGANAGSVCPKGGTHSKAGSGTYFLPINGATSDSGLGQIGWRWCSKCQGLWMAANAGSKCSADGKAHSKQGSGKYVLTFDSA